MSQEDPETLDLNIEAPSSEQGSSPLLCVGVSLSRKGEKYLDNGRHIFVLCHACVNFVQDVNIQE